eukprot:5225738-Pleurochrysis_carterae.AAC.1
MMQLRIINAKELRIPLHNIYVSHCCLAYKRKNTLVGPVNLVTFPICSEWQIAGSNAQLDKETARSVTLNLTTTKTTMNLHASKYGE